MTSLSKQGRERFAKVFTTLTAITTTLSLSGVAYLAPVALAVAPADYGLKEGDVVSAAGSDDPDVYIVNEMGYKRLFLNPAIFNFYGHLGGFAAVKNVSSVTRDAFGTSGLFRNCETNDEKVYGVETTGEDTGMLHWVNTPGSQAVIDDANFFKKVFCINSNEFNWYSQGTAYTSVNQVPSYVRTGVPAPVVGAVSASVASGNPVATTVTTNAQGVEMLRVRLSGTGTVNSMMLKRLGAGAVGDIANVYVYDGAVRLTSGKSLSAATGTVTFPNLKIDVSGSKDLSVVVELAGTAGNVNYFSLMEMTLASGTVSGLPVNGNNLTISGATSGRLDVAKVGSIANPAVGSKGAQLSEFKLTSVTEGANVKRLTLLQGGTVKPSDITNVKLKAGATEWSGSVTSTGYVVFDLGTGHLIKKGEEQVFKVYGDLAGKKDEDVNLYFENVSDVLAIGDQYGFGVATPSGTTDQGINVLDASSEAHDVTLQGGVLTIAFNGPSASNIGTNTSDTVLLRYSMTAATNIEVRRTKLVLCSDDDASGVFDDSDDGETQANWDDLTDIRITDEDTGTTIVGPKDGVDFNDHDNTNTSCSATADGTQENFTDVYELTAGKTYNFKVTGDVNTANGGFLDASDAIKVVLANWTTTNGTAGVPATPDVTVMKYAGTNTSVADADIVPQADISGPVLTIQASSLTLGLSTAVGKQTFVRGEQGKTAAGFTFQAGSASDLKVTDVILTGYIDDDGAGAFSVGATGTFNVANLVSAVSIYEVESGTVLSAGAASNQLSNATGTVTFNNLNWTIPAGGTKTLAAKVNLGSNELANTDYFSFDINNTTDVTALDKSSKTVNAGNADPNGTTPSIYMSVLASGSLSSANGPTTPSDHAVYWGQTGDTIGAWRFTATNEAFSLEKLQFQVATAAERTDATNNIKTLYLEYKNKDGATVTTTSTLNTVASAAFGFVGDNRPYVPKDGSLDLTLKADFKVKAEGATSSSVSTDQFNFSLMGSTGIGTNTFRAVGEGSGAIVKANSVNIATDRASTTDIMVFRVFPEFSFTAPTATKLSTSDPVLTFTITAKGLSDSRLLFDNLAVASGSLRFEVVASGVGANEDTAFTVRDASDNSIFDTGTIDNAATRAPQASLSIDFGSKDLEITGGASKTLKIFLDSITGFNTPINTSAGVGADYFQLVLRDEDDGTNEVVTWVANSASLTTDTDTQHVAGFLRLMPMAGYQFTAN
ncbi:MAG: hypothetical protein Q8Q89_01005 [bacterium]|nr:hypothetical protein [bacterium]